MGMVQLFVISGRSGSGKTVALRVLEDLGFYCIDNLPIIFLSKLISMAKEHYPKLALYRTARHDPEIRSTIVYLDASDEALVRRYSESRRLHPLSLRSLSLDEAISRESDMLMRISSVADLRIDTTNISIHELARQITVLVQGKPEKDLVIIFESFGFKDGIAMDADFVFDSRFLPNPFWNKELRNFTGLDKPVIDFFHNHPEVDHYIDMLYKLLSTWLKCIEKSNRSYLTVAIGCTGGRHRSVYIAQSLHDRFNKSGITAMVRHRTLIQEKNKA